MKFHGALNDGLCNLQPISSRGEDVEGAIHVGHHPFTL